MKGLWRDPGFKAVLLTFAVSRLALEVVGWVALWRVPGGVPPQPWPMPEAPGLLEIWIRWDSQWFLEIARRGYWLRNGLPMPQAFFPLYPLSIRYLAPLLGGQFYLAGLAIANAGFLAGLAAFYTLVAERWGRDAAVRAATYLILFPAGFYFSALYTEGLFFGLAVGAYLWAARQRWALAGLCGMGAALTRNLGVFLFIPLAWEYLARRGLLPLAPGEPFRALPPLRRLPGLAGARAAWLLLIPLGLGLYMGYLFKTTGNPLAYVDAEHRWGRAVNYPWAGLRQAVANVIAEPPPKPDRPGRYHNAYRPPYRRLYSALDLAGWALFALLLVSAWRRRLPYSFLIFLAGGLYFPLAAPALHSMTPLPSMWRYMAVLFPGFVSLALLGERPGVDCAVLIAFPMLQALFFLLFATWNWIA